MLSVRNIAAGLYQYCPSLSLDTPTNMAKKAAMVTVPALALIAAANADGAEAFTSCILCAACLVAANPGCILPCVICGVTIPVPVFVMGNATTIS